MKTSLKKVLALCLLGVALCPQYATAQKRKAVTKNKANAVASALPILPIAETTVDTTWMLSGGVAFELGIDLQLPACEDCAVKRSIRQWYKRCYEQIISQPHFSEARLERFALDAPSTTERTDSAVVDTTQKKKRKSRKERKAEAKRLAENMVTNKTPRHSLDIDVERIFENGYIATYRMQALTYAPNAAGQESNYYITVNKHTGEPLRWTDLYLSKQRSKFIAAIANGLQRYYHATDWKGLTPQLLNPALKASELPLPQSAPVIVENSLYAVYTSGEITPSTAEAPTVIIDTQWLKGLLTTAATNYFK